MSNMLTDSEGQENAVVEVHESSQVADLLPTHRWMRARCGAHAQPMVNANQSTSISAMISYIAHKSKQSEYRVERILSDHFNIPNAKCLSIDDFDTAIRYLADIIDV